MSKKIKLNERQFNLIMNWKMRAIYRIPELQYWLFQNIDQYIKSEGIQPSQCHLAESPASGTNYIIYDFYYHDDPFDIHVNFIKESLEVELFPVYMDSTGSINRAKTIREAIQKYHK